MAAGLRQLDKMIIGLTGTNAAGKGEVANYLKSRGFQYLSLSDIVREGATKQGLEHTRRNLIKVGNELRERFGAGILAEKTIDKIERKNCVIDSIRNTEEVNSLRSLPDFKLVCVDATIELRYKRAQERKTARDKISFKEFKRLEEVENFKSKTGQQLKQCIEIADDTIMNGGTLEELYKKIDGLLT